MQLMNFLCDQLYALWSFLIDPKQTLESQLQQDPWNTLLFCCVIIFLETGIILFPFLPGDILLILLGSLLPKTGISLNIGVALLILSAFLGAAVNYFLGRIIGNKSLPYLRRFEFFDKGFKKAEEFYKRHGGKAVVVSRNFGWVRTFVPFLSGVCKMDLGLYTLYNFLGGAIWISLFVYLGYFSPEWFSTLAGHWMPIGFLLPIVFYIFVR